MLWINFPDTISQEGNPSCRLIQINMVKQCNLQTDFTCSPSNVSTAERGPSYGPHSFIKNIESQNMHWLVHIIQIHPLHPQYHPPPCDVCNTWHTFQSPWAKEKKWKSLFGRNLLVRWRQEEGGEGLNTFERKNWHLFPIFSLFVLIFNAEFITFKT